MPEHFPFAEEFLFTFDKHVTSFNLFNDCNYHVIVEVVCSSVVQKVFFNFTATNFAFNMVSMVVESQVETCLALSYKLQLANLAFDNITTQADSQSILWNMLQFWVPVKVVLGRIL